MGKLSSLVAKVPGLRRFAKHYTQDIDTGHWINADWPWNWWQTGRTASGGGNGVVYACVQAYAQTIAQLPMRHLREEKSGKFTTITDGWVAELLAKPNGYQTRSDFLLNLVASLLYEGNTYGLGLRGTRAQVDSIHLCPPYQCDPSVSTDGSVFYQVTPVDVAGADPMIAPARDVLHVKLWTPQHPLKGVTPIQENALGLDVNNAIMGQQAAFFNNMNRPSGILQTDQQLTADQTAQLRDRWEQQAKGLNGGGVPILGWGIKWQPLGVNSVDAQLIDALKFSVKDIARIYRVPLPLIGEEEGASYNNVYNLLAFWKSSGLGFVVEHVQQAFNSFLGLRNGQSVDFDLNAMLRADFVSRIDALTKGITGGLYAPNEARRMEKLGDVEGGDMPRVQQQMIPLDYEEPAPAPAPVPEIPDDVSAAIARRAIEKAMT